jgi:hypothetical protein
LKKKQKKGEMSKKLGQNVIHIKINRGKMVKALEWEN